MSGTNKHFKHRRCYTTKADVEYHDGTHQSITLHQRRMTLQRMIRRYAKTDTPEAALWCAVLTRAVKDFCTMEHRPAFWRNGSADIICQTLGIEPEALHGWAKRLKLPLKSNVRRIRRMTPP